MNTPDQDTTLTFDECEEAGVDGTLRDIAPRKLISFAAARKLRYFRLCEELGYAGELRSGWGDDEVGGNTNHYADIAQIEGYPSDTGRYALIEYSKYGQRWITLFDSLEWAATAHVNQEYIEDWMDAEILDLADGKVYGIEYKAVTYRKGKS